MAVYRKSVMETVFLAFTHERTRSMRSRKALQLDEEELAFFKKSKRKL